MIQSCLAELFGLMNYVKTHQSGAFEDLVRNTIMKASLPQCVMMWGAFSALGTGDLFHCEKSSDVLEHRRILQNGLFPQLKSCYIKRNNQMLLQRWQT